MSLRASLSVLLGCQFGQASKLLDAAEHGQVATVKEVRRKRTCKIDLWNSMHKIPARAALRDGVRGPRCHKITLFV